MSAPRDDRAAIREEASPAQAPAAGAPQAFVLKVGLTGGIA